MADNKNRYQQLEMVMTVFVMIDLALFLAYLLSALAGSLALKIIFTVLSFVVSGCGIFFLWSTTEIKRPRSRWIVYALVCIPLCIIVSLICRFP